MVTDRTRIDLKGVEDLIVDLSYRSHLLYSPGILNDPD